MKKHRTIIILFSIMIVIEFSIVALLLLTYRATPVSPAATPHPWPATWTPTPVLIYPTEIPKVRSRSLEARCYDIQQWAQKTLVNIKAATELADQLTGIEYLTVAQIYDISDGFIALVTSQSNIPTTSDTESINVDVTASFLGAGITAKYLGLAIENDSVEMLNRAEESKNATVSLANKVSRRINDLNDMCGSNVPDFPSF